VYSRFRPEAEFHDFLWSDGFLPQRRHYSNSAAMSDADLSIAINNFSAATKVVG
jgi:hypothetical protein